MKARLTATAAAILAALVLLFVAAIDIRFETFEDGSGLVTSRAGRVTWCMPGGLCER